MADTNVSDINALVTLTIMPGLADLFFKYDPTIAYLRKNRWFVWRGGPQIQEPFSFRPMKGGAYAKGATFDITRPQTKAALLFDPRYYETNVTEYKEDVQIIVRGPQAVMSLVKADLEIAAQTMSALLACAVYRHGQNLAGDNRSEELNGLQEALTDGTNATYTGANFTSYGSQARADVSPALNSPTGIVSSPNVNGAISYSILERSYNTCVIGDEHPVMGVTTNRTMSFINENFQPQQRIDTKEPTIGFSGIKFKDATIVQSQYCPGRDITSQDVSDLGAYQTTAAQGETFWWLNPGPAGDSAFMKLYFINDPDYQFGFTGFKVAQDSTVVAGQILYAGAFTVKQSRLMRGLFGITS